MPLFADGDTGFGNVSNVARTTRAFERAGVAGFFIEDQVFPKRCGHMTGKAVVHRVITNLGVFDVVEGGLKRVELAPGVTEDEVRAATEATLV